MIHPAGAGDEGRAEATRGGDALARPGLVVARSGASGTSLGTLGLARVLVLSVKGGYGRVQEIEGRSVDKVVQARGGQVKRWHEVACHATAWHGLGCLIQTMSSASCGVDVVR